MGMRYLLSALVATLAQLAPATHVEAQRAQVGKEQLPASAIAVQPALVGTSLPNVGLRSAAAHSVTLAEARGGGKGSVLIIYRGGW